jgi:fluoride ion exporter CrcB/FEX
MLSPTGHESNKKDGQRSTRSHSQGEIWNVETFETVESHELQTAVVTAEGARHQLLAAGRPADGVEEQQTSHSGPFYESNNRSDGDDENDLEQPTSSSTSPLTTKFFASTHDEADEYNSPLLSAFTLQVIYNSVFAVFGTVVRIYMGRFFGLDCQTASVNGGAGQGDWFAGISEHVCVTANGKTDQTGGALFTDLPANVFGSFFMGLLSPVVALQGGGSHDPHPIAWFRQDHPLQTHPAFSMALKVGFCGCFTTFASWNTQMVVMLDGTGTVLGSQVVAALFGYLMGLSTSVASFLLGRHVYDTWRRIHRRRPHSQPVPRRDSTLNATVVIQAASGDDVEHGEDGVQCTEAGPMVSAVSAKESSSFDDSSCVGKKYPQLGKTLLLPDCFTDAWSTFFGIRAMSFLLLAGMTSGFVVGDLVYGSLFYRKMWMCVILSPFGALLRWYLSHKYNNVSHEERSTITITSNGYRLDWVPWGTVFANMAAVIISVLVEALNFHLAESPDFAWISPFLLAVETGFAGSLSTVSTFVRELMDMHETPTRLHLYGFGSLATAMLLGLLVYSPLIRYL